MKASTLVFCLSALFTGCQASNQPWPLVDARIESSQLVIQNNTYSDIFYFVIERNSLAGTEWLPCCRDGNKVKPLRTAAIRLTDESFRPSNEAVVFWWRTCVKLLESNAMVGKDLQSIVVRVR